MIHAKPQTGLPFRPRQRNGDLHDIAGRSETMKAAAGASLAFRFGTADAGLRVREARRGLAAAFSQAGLETPELDARLLVGHALGLDHGSLVAASDRWLGDAEVKQIEALASRRLNREPVARIIGEWEFWGLPIGLSPATLVPRPETETVVEAALAALDAEGRRNAELKLADLGTGSGALLLALLWELPHARGVGTDIDPSALTLALANARRLGLIDRASFLACDFAAALHGPFDLVVSNPPYVATGEIDSLAAEVRDHDPRRALDGGSDGLASYRKIAADAQRLLAPGGHLIVEIGGGQASSAAKLFCEAGLRVATPAYRDLAGCARALHISRKR